MPFSESSLPMLHADFVHNTDIWSATYQVTHGPRNLAENSRRPLRNQKRLPSLGSILLLPRITQGSKRHLSGGSQTVVRVSDDSESAKRYSAIGNDNVSCPIAGVPEQRCCTCLRRCTTWSIASLRLLSQLPLNNLKLLHVF